MIRNKNEREKCMLQVYTVTYGLQGLLKGADRKKIIMYNYRKNCTGRTMN